MWHPSAARNVPDNNVLFTRTGRKVTVTAHNWHSIWGSVKRKGAKKATEHVWFDTGNYIGSNYKHPLDIDWRHSWANFRTWKKRQCKQS